MVNYGVEEEGKLLFTEMLTFNYLLLVRTALRLVKYIQVQVLRHGSSLYFALNKGNILT